MSSLAPFQSWLGQHRYSVATVRNYLLDVSKYLEFVSKTVPVESNDYSLILSIDLISSYIKQLSGNSNSQRYLASLNTFCQFAVDQHLISSNPITKIRNVSRKTITQNPLQELRRHKLSFGESLSKHNYPEVTVRNYLNDVEQYISWLESNVITSPKGVAISTDGLK